MKVAVSYDNGEVFQHFGHTESFKVYDVEDGKVVSSQVIDSEGNGHDAIAGFLAENKVEVVICGGIGDGAEGTLSAAGIEICSGVFGNADEAVEAYLAGELISEGVNCDHHSHEEEIEEDCGCGCGSSCGSSCGGGCGGGCGGCGPMEPIFEGPNAGKKVKVHYTGTLDDGTKFDSSIDRNEPLEFTCGVGMMIPGFDKAVVTMTVGETVDIHIEAEDAYGPVDPSAIFTIKNEQLPGSENLEIGKEVYLSDGFRQFRCKVVAKEEDTITFDANHELAGKALNFKIELLEVEE